MKKIVIRQFLEINPTPTGAAKSPKKLKRTDEKMTRKALEKISGTVHQKTLEYKKNERKRLEAAGYDKAVENAKASVAGYLQALCVIGIITNRERYALYLYYATT